MGVPQPQPIVPHSYFRQPPRWRSQHLSSRPLVGRVRVGGQSARRWGKPPGPRRRIWPTLIKLGLAAAFVGVAGLAGAIAWYARDLPDPNRLIDRTVAQTTKLYDRTGEHLLYEIHGAQKRTIVPLDQIPQDVQHATLVAEDRDFYQHAGVSLRGILRAAFSHVTGIGKGGGGSTLTQQLVKNAILTNEYRLSRKLKELVLAWRIEQKFSKDQILQLYLNEIPYGGTSYGIQSAAQSYFGKNVGELSLAEAATLAAISNAPSALSPYTSRGLERLMARKEYVLNGMAEAGYVTVEQAAAAKAEDVKFIPRRDAITAPHFSLWVYDQLVERYGRRLVEEGGLKIVTTLDASLQGAAEAAIDAQLERNRDRYEAKNASLVALDVKTGQILAMVGSADFFDEEIDGQVNVALSPRQPGSSFKPIVYAAAFDAGYSPQTVVFDLETDFPTDIGKPYHPRNYDLKEHGPVTLRQALAGSLNIPAVKALYLAGIDRVLSLASSLGYSTLTDRSRFGLSLVLGGGEVPLLEHTAAYATLARSGRYLPPSPILRVEAPDGRALEEWREPRESEALRPEVAQVVTDVLSDNAARAFIFGASNSLTLPDRPVAAKTGTTNDYHDAWTVGYTPQIAAGVWVGNSNNDAMARGADGSVVAAPIWQRFMREAHSSLPVRGFSPPPPTFNLSSKPMLNGSWQGGVRIATDSRTGVLATPATPPEFVVERTYRQIHSVLYWVDRANPLGPVPQQKDPTFEQWEEPVRRWAAANGYVNEEPPPLPPTGDTNGPSVEITSPAAGSSITEPTTEVLVSAATPEGVPVAEWRLILDGERLASAPAGQPLVLVWPSRAADGWHTLSVVAIDALGRSGAKSIQLTLRRGSGPVVHWQAGQAEVAVGAPLPLRVTIESAEVRQVDFYAHPPVGAARWLGVAATPNDDGVWSVVWPGADSSGSYTLAALITDAGGNQWSGGSVTVVAR